MAIHRGIQSVIFYYLSCAPCSDVRYRKRRKQEAVRDRAERELLEAQMPNAYRHPSPSSTNPHWQTEISLGPTLPYRGKRKTQTAESQRALNKTNTQNSHGSNIPSSVDLPRSSSSDDRQDSKWNFRPYQRDDDELWGSTFTDIPLRNNLDGSQVDGLTVPARARTADSTASSQYQSFRNPALNDYHPAIVTRVESRDEVAWMLQPPPVAEVMSGKERAPRSRSDSGGSRPSASGSARLSRHVSARIIEQKLRTAEAHMPPNMKREVSGRSTNSTLRSSHDYRKTDETDFASPPEKRYKQRPAPLQLSDSTDSADTVIRQPTLAAQPQRAQQVRKKPSRPPLSTIMSESSDNTAYDKSYTPLATPKENALPNSRSSFDEDFHTEHRDKTSRRTELLGNDSSLKAFQDADRKPIVFDSQIFTESPTLERPLHGSDVEEIGRPIGDPELLDTWITPGFRLDKWVHEHTKREVKKRWSMDI